MADHQRVRARRIDTKDPVVVRKRRAGVREIEQYFASFVALARYRDITPFRVDDEDVVQVVDDIRNHEPIDGRDA